MAARKQPAQSPGERMVSEILAEMTEAGVQPDAKEVALLATARQLVDHLDALEQIIAKDVAEQRRLNRRRAARRARLIAQELDSGVYQRDMFSAKVKAL